MSELSGSRISLSSVPRFAGERAEVPIGAGISQGLTVSGRVGLESTSRCLLRRNSFPLEDSQVMATLRLITSPETHSSTQWVLSDGGGLNERYDGKAKAGLEAGSGPQILSSNWRSRSFLVWVKGALWWEEVLP